jgi:hypothetical protein
LYIYPYLFCEEVEKINKPVNFIFFFSVNDYEQDELDGPDYKKYHFNIQWCNLFYYTYIIHLS